MMTAAVQEQLLSHYFWKKMMNMLLCTAVLVLGISAFLVGAAQNTESWLTDFRFMTVNGTLYTVLIAGLTAAVSAKEFISHKEIYKRFLYCLRLSSAVTECVIVMVVALSFLPFIPDNPDILRYDSFCMHVVIPLLSVISFLLFETPEDRMKPLHHISSVWLIAAYAAVMIPLIALGVIPRRYIPYSFLDIGFRPLWYVLLAGMIVFSGAFLIAGGLFRLNQRYTDRWIVRVIRYEKGRRT